MTKLPNPRREASIFARAAQQELAQLRKAMRAAEDSIAGLNRAIKTPRFRTSRHIIKGSRTSASPWLNLARSFAGAFLASEATGYANTDSSAASGSGSDAFSPGSFYRSPSQQASRMVAMTLLGQRIR